MGTRVPRRVHSPEGGTSLRHAWWAFFASAAVACSHPPPAPPGPRTVLIGVARQARNDQASLVAFVPQVQATDSGGQCSIKRDPKVTSVTALFPNARDRQTMLTLRFDSAGTLVQYVERRGFPIPIRATGGLTPQQDSSMRDQVQNMKWVLIQFDYPIDRAQAMNLGGRQPSYSIEGRVSQLDTLTALGVLPRMERVRKLCGV
jgi:hypothetical protein